MWTMDAQMNVDFNGFYGLFRIETQIGFDHSI